MLYLTSVPFSPYKIYSLYSCCNPIPSSSSCFCFLILLASGNASHTSVSGRSCVCTAHALHLSHRVHSPGPLLLHLHQFHFYWLLPQNTAVPLDTKEVKDTLLWLLQYSISYNNLTRRSHGLTYFLGRRQGKGHPAVCPHKHLTSFHVDIKNLSGSKEKSTVDKRATFNP